MSFKNLKGDACNIKADEIQSMKPLKYHTENFFDIPGVSHRGVFFHDGFGIPVNNIDASTKSRFGTQTNINLPMNLPALPLNNVSDFYRGIRNVGQEDRLKPNSVREPKPCQPKDETRPFYERHFSIFDSLPVAPNSCWKNVVQKGTDYRQGTNSRHNKKSYQ